MSSEESDVIIQNVGNKGIIILNRPEKLNSLNIWMVKRIYAILKEWESQKAYVIIKGAGDVAFCSGGDLKYVHNSNKSNELGVELVKYQYMIAELISTYKIPYIAIIDGIVMGGGAGMSIHGRYRVATERTVFAMPETRIGWFPDNGASYFLPRLSGHVGYYLGLTGQRLRGLEVFKTGLATHYCPSTDLNNLEADLLKCIDDQDIRITLNNYSVTSSIDVPTFADLEKINYCFSAETVEDIILRLQQDASKWSKNTEIILLKCCPISLKVTLRALKLGTQLHLRECLNMENNLATEFSKGCNSREGIRALLVDKDTNPKWKPPTLAEVSEDDVLSFFESKTPKIQNKL